ncbi:MAG TPA: radical SAM protein [Polyangiaceae bacterium]|nr:radical SAM protein [Polyangiaceae bacterium]
MNVVFVNPPIRLPEVFAHYPLFSSLGMLSNAAWLRNQGHEVRVVDAFTFHPGLRLRPDGAKVRHLGAEVQEVADETARVRASMPGPAVVIVGLTMFSEMNRLRENLVPQTARALRDRLPDDSLGLADLYVCGMNYFPFDPARVMGAIRECDWILVGEGEPTLPELVRRLERQEPLAGLPRLACRERDGGISWNPEAPEPMRDLDELPPPAFDLLDMERYFGVMADAVAADLVHEYHVPERLMPLMTSRSCPYRCNFCTNQVLELPWRAHSVGYVRALARELRSRWGAERLLFLDDNINVDAERFRALTQAMAEEGIAWDAVNGYRADRLDRETVRAIKAAGNTKITVSAESGDPELLREVIGKGLKLSAVVELARVCEEERIPLQVHYIVGVPGETKAQINKTLEFATMLFELHGAWPLLQHAIPFPGTRMFRDCEARGLFVAPPFEIPGELLEVQSILRTPEFEPGEVIRMKRNAQHLHAAMQSLAYLDLGTGCELDAEACHCIPGPRDAPPPSLDLLRTSLERSRFLGAVELLLGGGEPTLREDLPEVVALGKELGFQRITVITHAHALADAALTRRLVEAGVNGLVVEVMGGSAAVHDAVAGRKGAFARMIAGVSRAQKEGIRRIDVSIPVTRTNIDELPAAVGVALRMNPAAIHLAYPEPASRAARQGKVVPWAEAKDRVAGALDVSRRVSVQGIPLCLLPDRPGAITPSPPWLMQRLRREKAKLPVCRDCVGFILCGGPFREEHDRVYGMHGEVRVLVRRSASRQDSSA